MLAQSLQNKVSDLSATFSAIYLTDSTSFQLPAHLAPFYQSNDGDTTGASLYTKTKDGSYEPLGIESYLRQATTEQPLQNQAVYFGEQKTRCRLISQAVPEEVKQQRREKYRKGHANQSKKGKQWEMTALKGKLCGYNLYLTNAPQTKLPVSSPEIVRFESRHIVTNLKNVNDEKEHLHAYADSWHSQRI